MGRIIAGMYEIQQQIGSGGGGVVYLGLHLRLNKQIVLKADKRPLTTKPEVLRREVDMLKGLSHTFIPQVYDFVWEDGIVYTVMDYIEGESLDRILDRGQTPPQPQLIQWACQLLEALSYLHSRPPHGILHGDIKPANIMLRPDGNLCLIDYNIALALGEDGAIKVGYSSGYASPEHYGSSNLERESVSLGSGSSAAGRAVMLDVRSDIYSLGATLYHLISGQRPPKDPQKTLPLREDVCSPAVARIIKKAMALEPENRYQTAEEMLTDFRQLHRQDKRTLRRRRRIRLTAGLCALVFLVGGSATFVGLKQMEQRQEALALSGYSADELAKGNVSEAVRLALQAIPSGDSIWEAPVTPQARKALTDALGVYELEDRFRSFDQVTLPAAPYGVAMAPGGTRFAAVYQYEAAVFDTESRRQLAALPILPSALSEAVFVDEERLLYAGEQGVSLYDIEKEETLWTGEQGVSLALSGDGQVAAAADRSGERAVIYRLEDGSVQAERSFEGKHRAAVFNDIFANPQNAVFALNEDGTMLAVSFSDGGLLICDLEDPQEDLIMYETSPYTSFEGDFFGKYFAFVASKSDQSVFGLIDTEQGVYTAELESREQMRMGIDPRGIWLSEGNLLVCFDGETLEDQEMAFTGQHTIRDFSVGGSYVLVTTDDPGFSVYDGGANEMLHETTEESCDFIAMSEDYALLANRNQPQVRLLKRKSHEDARIASYDPRDLHDEARVSGDQKTIMLFDYEGFRIYDREGARLAEGTFPLPEEIYDQQFRREENSWLEVIWYDGTVRCYSASDGSLLREEEREPPRRDLYEEFLTERYRFVSELHSAPQVYDRETGTLAAELESDAYLTYVTETGDYIITEYVSAAGERFGLLLDQSLQTLARLPGMCDMVDGMVVFDYNNGDLRQCRLYSLQELIALGEQYKE